MNVYEALKQNSFFGSFNGQNAANPESEPSPEDYREAWNAAASALADVYVAGTGDWIRENYPELADEIREADEELNALWWGDIEAFREAVTKWRDLYLRGIKLWEGRAHTPSPDIAESWHLSTQPRHPAINLLGSFK